MEGNGKKRKECIKINKFRWSLPHPLVGRPLDGSELLGNASEIIGLKPWRSDRLWACAVGWVSDTETVRTFKTEHDIKIERINRENHESRNDIARNDC